MTARYLISIPAFIIQASKATSSGVDLIYNYSLRFSTHTLRFIEQTIEKGLPDKVPSTYKDIDTVIANQDYLIEVIHT